MHNLGMSYQYLSVQTALHYLQCALWSRLLYLECSRHIGSGHLMRSAASQCCVPNAATLHVKHAGCLHTSCLVMLLHASHCSLNSAVTACAAPPSQHAQHSHHSMHSTPITACAASPSHPNGACSFTNGMSLAAHTVRYCTILYGTVRYWMVQYFLA